MDDAPNAWRIQNVLSVWQSARARLLNDDPALDQDEAALTELLGPVEGDVKEILARVCRAAKHAEMMAEGAKVLAAKTSARKKRYDTRYESLRGLAMSMMEAIGTRKEEYPDLTVNISAGKQGVRITDEKLIPDIYVEVVTERKPDKATILSALKASVAVAGCELGNGMDTITIRMS